MKHILTLGIFLLITFRLFAQTDGLSYQAVIIAPDVLELPGVDSEGNYLPNANVAVKFIIFDSGNQVEFEEIQTTTTDEFGRINLIIGAVEHDNFEKISWDGTPKDLKVEINFGNGDGYIDMSREVLTFVPYAYHRNITATGTLDVDDDTFLNRELTVGGPTTLNSTLLVDGGNESNLTGDLTVDGVTNLNSDLNVNNQSTTNLSGALNVGVATGLPDDNAPTVLNGSLTVVGESSFTGLTVEDLTVNNSSELNGSIAMNSDSQITITSSLDGDDDTDINNYPLKIEGGQQGIAIVVNESRTNKNNFISFWDTTASSSPAMSGANMTTTNPTMWGRIEGETPSEYTNNADYNFDQRSLQYDIFDASFDVLSAVWDTAVAVADNLAAASAAAPCVGPIPCVALPPPSFIISTKFRLVAEAVKTAVAIAGEVIAIDNLVTYNNNKDTFQGVTYASGAGDYAEYLLRENIGEKMTYGDVVGVKGGKISKNLAGAERIMVVSYKPIVLGNMPQQNEENQYEKVAFMGQVPVKVFGKVNIGDYIIPSGKNDGIGIAVKPSLITINQIKDIVGVAWSESDVSFGFSLINVAVGLNRNDSGLILGKLENKVNEQAQEINTLKRQIEEILTNISRIESGHVVSSEVSSDSTTNEGEKVVHNSHSDRKVTVIEAVETEIIYFEITRQDIEDGLAYARKTMTEFGEYDRNREFFERIDNDTEFRERFIDEIQKKLDKQVHYHKAIDKKGRH
ncbi:hypothetical protein [Litoribaculum gwangyangense]|uniref:Peptidase S74 domain-containing protein n=1 Tax=Litoribaculum gwangyangense TaxID=1130722 RepID=A0ABP9CJK1_9FLAO